MIRMLWEDWKGWVDAPKTAFMATLVLLISGAMTFDLVDEDPAVGAAWPMFIFSIGALLYCWYRIRGGPT
jgi:hypothetical protein